MMGHNSMSDTTREDSHRRLRSAGSAACVLDKQPRLVDFPDPLTAVLGRVPAEFVAVLERADIHRVTNVVEETRDQVTLILGQV